MWYPNCSIDFLCNYSLPPQTAFCEPFFWFHLSKLSPSSSVNRAQFHFFRFLWLCVTLHCVVTNRRSFFPRWRELTLYGLISIEQTPMQIIINIFFFHFSNNKFTSNNVSERATPFFALTTFQLLFRFFRQPSLCLFYYTMYRTLKIFGENDFCILWNFLSEKYWEMQQNYAILSLAKIRCG